MRKAKKVEIVDATVADWYYEIKGLGCIFEVTEELGDAYGICMGGVSDCFIVGKEDVKVVEWAEPSYADRQAEWIKKNDLKIGSRVKFVREFEGWKYGFDYYNPEGYLYSKNSIYTIKKINDDHIQVEENPYPLPYFAFEPVRDEAVL